jgi:hypothetical protein
MWVRDPQGQLINAAVSVYSVTATRPHPSLHIHVDIFADAFFDDDDDDRPEPSHSLAEVTAALERFFGMTASFQTRAKFSIPLGDVPQAGLVRLLLGVENATTKLTGARFSVRNDSIKTVNWFVTEGATQMLWSEMTGKLTDVVDNQYLVRMADHFEETFSNFILERGNEQPGL